MKLPAVLIALTPWLMTILVIMFDKSRINDLGLLWLMLSPVAIAGSILVAYREGQWSNK